MLHFFLINLMYFWSLLSLSPLQDAFFSVLYNISILIYTLQLSFKYYVDLFLFFTKVFHIKRA